MRTFTYIRHSFNASILAAAVGITTIAPQSAEAQNFFGPRVFLQAQRGGYAMAWGGGGDFVYSNSGNMQGWEEFEIWDINGGEMRNGDRIGIRTAISRHFLSDIGGGNSLRANVPWCNTWEVFTLHVQGGGVATNNSRIALQGWSGFFVGPNYYRSDAQAGTWFTFGGWGSWEDWKLVDKHDTTTGASANWPKNNCVMYVKARVPAYSRFTGLYTLEAKRRTINIWDINSARPGDVAIINASSAGHVAVVEQNHGDGTITIREGNYPAGTIRSRRDRPANLKVQGYFRP